MASENKGGRSLSLTAFDVFGQTQPMNSNDLERCLRSASGWLDLGEWLAADQELDSLPPILRAHPEVLKMRCEVYTAAENWDHLHEVAGGASKAFPDIGEFLAHYAWGLHRKNQSKRALEVMNEKAQRFPKNHLVAYYMACFLCVQNRISDAEPWLAMAFETSEDPTKLKTRALDQPELQNIWAEIQEY